MAGSEVDGERQKAEGVYELFMLLPFSPFRLPAQFLPELLKRFRLGERFNLNLAPTLRPPEVPKPSGDDHGATPEVLEQCGHHLASRFRVGVLDVEQRTGLAQPFTDRGGAIRPRRNI